jgi:hypothetical protein
MMRALVRSFRYLRYLRSRERIMPMAVPEKKRNGETTLLSRALGLNGTVTSGPVTGLK